MKKEKPARKKVDLSFLKDRWPSGIVARNQVLNFSGGAIGETVMKRLDQQGAGPEKMKVGGRVAYRVDDLIQWLEKRTILKEVESDGQTSQS
jgi:hypothetical protein